MAEPAVFPDQVQQVAVAGDLGIAGGDPARREDLDPAPDSVVAGDVADPSVLQIDQIEELTAPIRDALDRLSGGAGEVDLAEELWGPVFEPLQDHTLFSQVRFDPESATVTWPNGADLAPEFLYERIHAKR